MPESERSDENGMVILSRVNACAPPLFLDSKEGVGEKASAPQSAGETSAISRSEPRTKEQSYFRSPTEIPLKEHQPNKLQKPESSKLPP